ncbi:MAG TPA: hypothetical protein HA252_03995 [Candidatus Diapherotrites archaeon]|uniref:Uncharacterized protein n=1 Tax=Candidatus Iainarchaeum sp. TaxID=3101447 RepID=A0A7J4JIU9_9ARCH|nr:hypothetical protein [Candidatus Diapherotrites archaeon]
MAEGRGEAGVAQTELFFVGGEGGVPEGVAEDQAEEEPGQNLYYVEVPGEERGRGALFFGFFFLFFHEDAVN